MRNAMSIDLEEWFCVSNFEAVIPREEWPRLESRVERSTATILEILERRKVRATFFVLGWVAERHPGLIRGIADAGHEIASHGYGHRLVYELTPDEFQQDIARSVELIEEIAGVRCAGYRAPSFSLRRDCDWAWEALAGSGIRYDSSVFPVHHDRYGEPDAPRRPHLRDSAGGRFVEFPPSTVSLFGKNIPVAGGGYFRLYPLAVTRWAIRRLQAEGIPANIYLHPWEFDPDHPKPEGVSGATLARHRVGLAGVARKLDALLSEFPFGSVLDALEDCGHSLGTAESV